MFRFIHASDLHLGAPFEGIRLESAEIADELGRSTYRALDSIVRLATDEAVAFVLLAGDICNRATGNLGAQLALREAARTLGDAGIALLIVHGNHDYLAPDRPDLDWPDNCTVFGPDAAEPVILHADGREAASVFGLSYSRRDETANLAKRFPKPPDGLFSIGLLHTACGPVSDHAAYAPCTPTDLVELGYDYWALGHVHARTILREASPCIAYSGCPQGLNPKEQGPKGVLLVTVGDNGGVTTVFRETDAVRWHIVDVDVTPFTRDQDLLDALEACVAERAADGRTALVRFRLIGRGPLHRLQSDGQALADMRIHLRSFGATSSPPIWTESIQVLTQPDLDIEARRKAEDLLGDFLRIAEDARASDEQVAELIKVLGQPFAGAQGQALREVGLTPKWITPEKVREWLTEAEWMGADRLIRAEE
ncbi:MAG: DNA repair exonuclease [Armatimonadetes bacterium]|nr:DNA repair exonuclease [Armatimonadota bacterium]